MLEYKILLKTRFTFGVYVSFLIWFSSFDNLAEIYAYDLSS